MKREDIIGMTNEIKERVQNANRLSKIKTLLIIQTSKFVQKLYMTNKYLVHDLQFTYK